jgi:hypothetical protein
VVSRDVHELIGLARDFRRRLDAVKSTHSGGFEWYPYDSLSNLAHFDKLLSGQRRDIPALAAGKPILDAGCADGDLAFFFESLGCEVHAVDHPVSNHNGMAGVYTLKEALGSKIEIHAADLDAQFSLPRTHYSLAFLLGALYHLKNPFYVLEKLSQHCNYCLLSTRIARAYPDGTPIGERPVAYLVDDLELNADDSNFWIFSPAGLRRLLKRAHWEVLDQISAGDSAGSDPVSRDERTFCLVRSTWALANVDLLEGWHEAESEGWRWTMRRFAAKSRPARALRLKFYVPPRIIEELGPVTLSVSANGRALRPERYERPGDQVYERRLPESEAELHLEFALDRCLVLANDDERELGVVVAALELE